LIKNAQDYLEVSVPGPNTFHEPLDHQRRQAAATALTLVCLLCRAAATCPNRRAVRGDELATSTLHRLSERVHR